MIDRIFLSFTVTPSNRKTNRVTSSISYAITHTRTLPVTTFLFLSTSCLERYGRGRVTYVKDSVLSSWRRILWILHHWFMEQVAEERTVISGDL